MMTSSASSWPKASSTIRSNANEVRTRMPRRTTANRRTSRPLCRVSSRSRSCNGSQADLSPVVTRRPRVFSIFRVRFEFKRLMLFTETPLERVYTRVVSEIGANKPNASAALPRRRTCAGSGSCAIDPAAFACHDLSLPDPACPASSKLCLPRRLVSRMTLKRLVNAPRLAVPQQRTPPHARGRSSTAPAAPFTYLARPGESCATSSPGSRPTSSTAPSKPTTANAPRRRARSDSPERGSTTRCRVCLGKSREQWRPIWQEDGAAAGLRVLALPQPFFPKETFSPRGSLPGPMNPHIGPTPPCRGQFPPCRCVSNQGGASGCGIRQHNLRTRCSRSSCECPERS